MKNTSTDTPNASGKIILELRDGRLFFCPVGASDEEVDGLLSAIRDRIACGDLVVLIEGQGGRRNDSKNAV
jgi:hypothetical protein